MLFWNTASTMKMAKVTEKARPMIKMARSLIIPLGTPLISSGSYTEKRKRINTRGRVHSKTESVIVSSYISIGYQSCT